MRPWSLSARLLAAVLAAAGIPFAVFTVYTVKLVRTLTSEARVERFLRSTAIDVAEKVNTAVRERHRELLGLAANPLTADALEKWSRTKRAYDLDDPAESALALQDRADAEESRIHLTAELEANARRPGAFRLVVVLDKTGFAVAHGAKQSAAGNGWRVNGDVLASGTFFQERWFDAAVKGHVVGVDWHRDRLVHRDVAVESDRPEDYDAGFAAPVRDPEGVVLGVLYALMDWTRVSCDILDKEKFNLQNGEGVKVENGSVGYAFLWDAAATRILAHPNRALLTQSLDRLDGGGLAGLLVDVRAMEDVNVFKYRYEGAEKRSGFCRTYAAPELAAGLGDASVKPQLPLDRLVLLDSENSGFGWIVGATVHDVAIFAPLREALGLIAAALLTGGLALALCVFAVSRAVTRPLRDLTLEAAQVARGKFTARVKPSGPRETASLARSFNQMAEDLEKSQADLIRAEKDAAWREMARQVSHDVKNPLTPMKLWVQLLERAWNDRSPEFESILRRACGTLDNQIEILRRSAADFLALAGSNSAPAGGSVRLGALLDAVVDLYAAVARERGVALARSGDDAEIPGDFHRLQRVFVNLLDNALEAAPRGTAVDITVEKLAGRVRIAVTDRGPGIPAEARVKLFTPNFSTKTHGTGLGLANVRWIVEAHGGRVYLDETRRDATSLVVELPEGAGGAPEGKP